MDGRVHSVGILPSKLQKKSKVLWQNIVLREKFEVKRHRAWIIGTWMGDHREVWPHGVGVGFPT